jgi:hypothetical protein
MAQYVALRTLSRGVRIRIKNSAGVKVTLSPTADTVVDLDDVDVRRTLANHGAIGQYTVTAANARANSAALPPNTP